MSRSFGDFELKHFSNRPYAEQAVVSVPEIIEMERKPTDQFLLMGCDGIWERF